MIPVLPLRPWLITTTAGSASVLARGEAAAIQAGLELAQPPVGQPRATLISAIPQGEW